jgi:hypothetical protein
MAAQRGGSGTVTNPVTTATKLAFTKSFGTICLTGLIMYIVELLQTIDRLLFRQGRCVLELNGERLQHGRCVRQALRRRS